VGLKSSTFLKPKNLKPTFHRDTIIEHKKKLVMLYLVQCVSNSKSPKRRHTICLILARTVPV